jgi:hypothetical protein
MDMGVGTGQDGMWGEGSGSAHGGFDDLRAMRMRLGLEYAFGICIVLLIPGKASYD